MTLIRRVGPSEELLRLARETEEFLRETAALYRGLSTDVAAAEAENPAKARERMHEYRRAALAALEDGRRVADELNAARGIVHDFALDLQAARDEVERLLDRFEAALRAEGIS